MLQHKAYGRGGGLTDVEARRLRELEQAVTAPAMPAGPAPGGIDDGADDVSADVPESGSESDPGTGTGTDATTPASESVSDPSADFREMFTAASTATAATATAAATTAAASAGATEDVGLASRSRTARAAVAGLRRYGAAVAVVSVLLVAIGIGAGWALFGQRADAIALTGEQQQRQVDLYDEADFDEGTLRAIAQDEEGALAWYGTKQDGEMACLVIDVGEESGRQCQRREDVDGFGLGASVTQRSDADAGNDVTVNAYLLYSPSGEPLVAIQRWEQQPDAWLLQFDPDERSRAGELLSQYDASNLTVIGSFRDEPVWLLDQPKETGAETCLIVDAVPEQEQCVSMNRAVADGISSLVFVDDGAGGSEAWTIQVAYTVGQTPYLVITRDPAPGSVTLSEDSDSRDDAG